MQVIHRNFDGLDIAFQGQISPELAEALEAKKQEAIDRNETVLLDYNGQKMHVSQSGGRGGYAYLCDTGPEGAIWFFRRPNVRDEWGIRVSVKSLPLALYGLGGVRARIIAFLEAIGLPYSMERASIGRVDYAIDVLAPGFTLDPENFVMHSHTTRGTHREAHDVMEHGRSGRVTSVTIGKMPGRQVIVYDKRAEVITKHKIEWWEIWNAGRRKAGLPELIPSDRESSQVWRIEFRAGKKHLKEQWGIDTWQRFDSKIGDLFQRAAESVRYVIPRTDTNRGRWPLDPLWALAQAEISSDLFEMRSYADPGAVRAVMRDAHLALLTKQATGLAATISYLEGLPDEEAATIADRLAAEIRMIAEEDPEGFHGKRRKAAERYWFMA